MSRFLQHKPCLFVDKKELPLGKFHLKENAKYKFQMREKNFRFFKSITSIKVFQFLHEQEKKCRVVNQLAVETFGV